MKIILPSHEHISKKGLTPYEFVEKIGRLCYKSEDKITQDSSTKFVRGLVKRGHTAMTEHFWVHITFHGNYVMLLDQLEDFVWNVLKDAGDTSTFFKYMQVTYLPDIVFISCPIRALTVLADWMTKMFSSKELDWKVPPLIRELFYQVYCSYSEFFSEDVHLFKSDKVCTHQFSLWTEESFLDRMTEHDFCDNEDCRNVEIMKHVTHTVRFVCDRGVSHELVRHRPCSFAQESTRYCNYSQDKFGEEITVIKPLFFEQWDKDLDNKCETMSYGLWARSCEQAEKAYFNLLKEGATPQEARSVLPNSLKTEIIMTANETEWQHIVNLRAKGTTGKPHPQMVEIMQPWYEELKVLSEGRIS